MNQFGFWAPPVVASPDVVVMPPAPVTPAHLGGSHVTQPDMNTFLPDIWERLITKYDVRSVLDLGCGGGWSTRWFGDRLGSENILGIEGDPVAVDFAREHVGRQTRIVEFDFTKVAWAETAIFDLGWCAEFVEHVEAAYIQNWMRALQNCRHVCMTFAVPGQGGHHHVNEQLEAYWEEKFAAAGFDLDREETTALRMTSKGEAWGRPTLTMFRNNALSNDLT